MNRVTDVVVAMQRLLDLFTPHCTDRSTLDELAQLILDHSRWGKAHDLFDRIRLKNLDAIRKGDHLREAQYCFEEVCAKTIYNLSREAAPFDPDSPYWIVPNAFVLARKLKVDDSEVLQIIVT